MIVAHHDGGRPFQFAVPSLVEEAIRLDGNKAIIAKVASELTPLTSVLVLPLVSIVVALVYLKMRRLGGEESRGLVHQIDREPESQPQATTKTK